LGRRTSSSNHSNSSSNETSTGSAILDTYLQFIAENSLFK
jgi:hypothetical protein